MIRLDDVRARIGAKVPALAGHLEGAAKFSQLVEHGTAPQQDRIGYVLPGPLVGGTPDVAAGIFRQAFRETVIVVLFLRVAGDPRGDRAVDQIAPIIRAVVEAVAGWAPEDAVGVFALGQGELTGSQAGALIYELQFTLEDQLRIIS